MPDHQAVTGSSEPHSLSLQEAFEDAVKQLNRPGYPDELITVVVEEIGAEVGGIAGLQRATIRLRRA